MPLSVKTILGGTAWSAGGAALGLRGSCMQFGRTWALSSVLLGVFGFLMQTTCAHDLLVSLSTAVASARHENEAGN